MVTHADASLRAAGGVSEPPAERCRMIHRHLRVPAMPGRWRQPRQAVGDVLERPAQFAVEHGEAATTQVHIVRASRM